MTETFSTKHILNSIGNKMLAMLCSMLRKCCRIYSELPDAETSTANGDGIRRFYKRNVSNLAIIHPRLRDGTRAAYICPDDVRLTVFNADHRMLRVQTKLDITIDGEISLQYMLGDDCDSSEIQACVHACGTLLVDVRVRCAIFEGRSGGRFCGRHALASTPYFATSTHYMAIHPAGTHLVVGYNNNWTHNRQVLDVYGLPEMNFLSLLDLRNESSFKPNGMCFTDVGTLLVSDIRGDRVRHWTLGGSCIASYSVRKPSRVASRGDTFVILAISNYSDVCVYSLDSATALHTWSVPGYICEVIYADAATLAFSNYAGETIDLYALDGAFLRQLAVNIRSTSLAVCADGCLLANDRSRRCIRVFALDGTESTTSPLTTHVFGAVPAGIAVCGARAYVLENGDPMHVYVFE